MIHPFTYFQWTVVANGYRIASASRVAGDGDEEVFVTDSVSLGESTMGRIYSPHTGLFRVFAELSPKSHEILLFAGRWGMLTEGVSILEGNRSTTTTGELLSFWKNEIADLSLALQIWELVKAGDAEGLSQFICWPSSSGVRFNRPNSRGFRWIASRETNKDLLDTFKVGDLIAPARHQLQHIVNEKLEGNVSARLLWASPKIWNCLSLYQVPKDLISALWLQLARGIEGNREYHQCSQCRNWFEVSSPDGSRRDKLYCSTACRARKWRSKSGPSPKKVTRVTKGGRSKKD